MTILLLFVYKFNNSENHYIITNICNYVFIKKKVNIFTKRIYLKTLKNACIEIRNKYVHTYLSGNTPLTSTNQWRNR